MAGILSARIAETFIHSESSFTRRMYPHMGRGGLCCINSGSSSPRGLFAQAIAAWQHCALRKAAKLPFGKIGAFLLPRAP
ncbi:hypothetical protein [Cereibacter ovatus]|uniref:hypothetical protein n=1 Tax=Cereibacter ovatus TaxID=439529 RepID=UPI0011442CED|nr:hypothetical protein [Cereibacter ovatus]